MSSKRAGGWQDCSERNPCPACQAAGRGAHPAEGNTWCSWNERLIKTDTEAFTCCKSGGTECPPGWRIFSTGDVGTVYVPTEARLVIDQDPQARVKRAEREAKAEADAEIFRNKARREGKQKWDLCGNETIVGVEPACRDGRGPDHPRVIAYLEARGLRIDDLPGGRLPRSIRYHGSMRDGVSIKVKSGPSRPVFFDLPAMVCLAVQKNRRRFGSVQRIYLDPTGEPKKAPPPEGVPEKNWDPKRAKGSFLGAAVRLHSPRESGVLVLTEGVETGLFCLAATHVGVWSCVSTAGLEKVELDEDYIGENGCVHTVIVAADCDRTGKKGKRAGQDSALKCVRRLATRHPQLKVRLAVPIINDAPDHYDATGEPKGKSVDWLDVYNASGKERVRKALLELAELCNAGIDASVAQDEGWGGDEGRGVSMLGGDFDEPIPDGHLPRARTLLLDWRDFSPEPEKRPGQRHYVVRTNKTTYRYMPGDRPRWVSVSDESLRGLVWSRLQRYKRWDDDVPVDLNPEKKDVDSIYAAMMAEVAVETTSTSAWINPTYDSRGKAIWRGEGAFVEPEPADWHIPCANGILDVNALVNGEVKIQPHTPRLFSLSCRPFAVDQDLLKRLINADDKEADELGRKHWPAFSEYLRGVSGGDRDWIELLQRATGICLTPDVSYEKIFLLPGPGGSGKSTYLEILAAIVGKEGFVTTTLSWLSRDFGLVPLVGKNVVALSDAGAGRHTDLGQSLEMLKMISGGDQVTVEYKGINEMPTLQLSCKIFIATNDMPTLPDSAGALERRLVPIPFSIPLGENADRSVKARVQAEAPGIFLWALRGLVNLRRDPAGFKLTERGEMMVQEIKESNAPMFVFLSDECLVGKRYSVTKKEFREAYNKWAEERNHPEYSDAIITKKLRAVLPQLECAQDSDKERTRIYRGLKLRSSLTIYEGGDSDDSGGGDSGADRGAVSPVPPSQEEIPF